MADEQEECIYVAGLLLDQLVEGEQWSLPFLTEVVKAITTVIRAARLANRAEKDADPTGGDAQVIKDLSSYMEFHQLRHVALKVGRMDLLQCQAEVLVRFS